MRLSLIVIAAASTMLSAAAFGEDTTPPQQQPDPNEIVCRSGEPLTGTRIPGPRVCRTQREWDDLRQQSQDALSHTQINTFSQSKGS